MFQSVKLRLILLCGVLAASPAPGQGVSGVLRDATGRGLTNIGVEATVFASMSFTQMVTETDAAGRFGFPAQTGSWTVRAAAANLNALGYLDVSPASLSLSNESKNVRFTTRRLDLNHRLNGRLIDDTQWPLSGAFLRASIRENGQQFETNVLTGFDGRFSLVVSPALWRIDGWFGGGTGNYVFPAFDALVEPTNSETAVQIVAPRVTANISGVASNLAGFEIVAECEAYGSRYIRTAYVGNSISPFFLPVFNGIWTVSVTNQNYGFQVTSVPPRPVVVTVTNGNVELQFNGSHHNQQVLRVNVMAPDGAPVTNASTYTTFEGQLFPNFFPLPIPTPDDPSITLLQLEKGRWNVNAFAVDPATSTSWEVSRDVIISLNGVSNLNLVMPRHGVGPRISGVVRESDGDALPGREVLLHASEQGTNYRASVIADASGSFAVHVVPGRWLLGAVGSDPCWLPSLVTVSDVDQQVALLACGSPYGDANPVAITVRDEAGPSELGFQISLTSSRGYYWTNIAPRTSVLAPLRPGIWTAQMLPDWSTSRNDPYELLPTLKFQHPNMGSTNLILITRTGSARIEGRLREVNGRLLTTGYATARANIGGTNYAVTGQLASGYFSLNVIPGEWEVAASTWRYPADGSPLVTPLGIVPNPLHTDPAPQFLRATNGITMCEFVAGEVPPRVSLTVLVIGEDGVGLAGAAVQVSGSFSGEWREVDPKGMARFDILPGTNSIQVSWGWHSVQRDQLLFPSVPLNLRSASNHVVLVARAPAVCVRGTVSDMQSNSLPLLVIATGQVDGTNYTSSVCPDSCREFCLPVIHGDWQVSVPDWVANDLGFQSVPSQDAFVPPSGPPPTIDFVLEPIVGDFRNARWSPPTMTPTGELKLELRTQAKLTWRVERSEDLKQWNAWSTVTTSNGIARIPHPVATPGRSTFFRAVWVQ